MISLLHIILAEDRADALINDLLTSTKVSKSPQEILKEIPTFFWRSKVASYIPSNAMARRNLCRETTDQLHYNLCSNKDFHLV